MPICVICHNERPVGGKFCPHCGAAAEQIAVATAPVQPPQWESVAPGKPEGSTEQIAVETPVQPLYASLGKRFLAQLLDGIVAFVIFWLLGRTVAARFGGLTDTGFEMTGFPAILVMFSTALLLFLYFLLCEATTGATLGKVVAGIRVLSLEGNLPGMKASLIRNLLRLVDGIGAYLIGAIVVLVSKRRQRLGDMAAGTIVVKNHFSRLARLGSLIVLIGVFAGAILFSVVSGAKKLTEESRSVSTRPVEGKSGPPRFATAILTDNEEGRVEKNSFSPDTEKIYVVFALADVPVDTPVKAVWIAEKVEGVAADYKINEYEVKGGGPIDHGNFSLLRPDKGWPPGDYRVELYLDGHLTNTARFQVKAPATVSNVAPDAASRVPAGDLPQFNPSGYPIPNLEGFKHVRSLEQDASDQIPGKETTLEIYTNGSGDRIYRFVTGGVVWAYGWMPKEEGATAGYLIRDPDCSGKFTEQFTPTASLSAPNCAVSHLFQEEVR